MKSLSRRKRGRKPGTKNKTAAKTEGQPATAAEETNNTTPQKVSATNTPKEKEVILPELDFDSDTDDFIPIEDLLRKRLNFLLNYLESLKQPKNEAPVPTVTPASKFQPRQPREQNPRYNNPNQRNNNNYNNQRPTNNNNTEGLESPQQPQQSAPERKPVEKPYEFEGILTGTGVLEIMPDGYGFPSFIRLQLPFFAR